MPLYLVVIVLQVVCVIHVVKTGRNQIWIYVLVLLSLAGIAAYLIAELLPDLLGGRGARRLAAGTAKRLDPGRGARRRAADLDMAETAENKRLLAEEYLGLGRIEEAVGLYESALTGPHADDPTLWLGLARAQHQCGDAEAALHALDRLRNADADFQSAEGHLIYACSLEALGRDGEALVEYEAISAYFLGEEARCRHALLLLKCGRIEHARSILDEIVKRAARGTRRYRREQAEWIEIARQTIARQAVPA
ncbi:MAG TPA: tetratricopeptide repeat protein [Aliidongia sp.]|uniref:tetratricopeptide repeat protein n=1 Tax=Aliidongia sp. TaxID=1914230 RepID=UPI002DDD95FE|nr:tetratricopeptide repeat protein [Aliidongia sp.]HEV2677110.1 tetratricopeptide repeat protein [Aliidongia sp.]